MKDQEFELATNRLSLTPSEERKYDLAEEAGYEAVEVCRLEFYRERILELTGVTASDDQIVEFIRLERFMHFDAKPYVKPPTSRERANVHKAAEKLFRTMNANPDYYRLRYSCFKSADLIGSPDDVNFDQFMNVLQQMIADPVRPAQSKSDRDNIEANIAEAFARWWHDLTGEEPLYNPEFKKFLNNCMNWNLTGAEKDKALRARIGGLRDR